MFVLALLGLWSTSVGAAREPLDMGLQERVDVARVQIEAVLWPKHGGPAQCDTIDARDIELFVRHRLRPAAIDFVGREPASPSGSTFPRPPRLFVLLIDEEHFCLCPMEDEYCARGRAYRQARDAIARLEPGDRVMLATFFGAPVLHTGWLTSKERALEALGALEATQFWLRPRGSRISMRLWYRKWCSLLDVLGTTPGHKDLLLLTTDFPTDIEDSLYQAQLGSHAQADRVAVHPVDLIHDIGKHVIPFGLVPFAEATGGKLFSNGETAASSMEKLREMDGCRILLTFELSREEARRAPVPVRVVVWDRRFRAEAPTALPDPFAIRGQQPNLFP